MKLSRWLGPVALVIAVIVACDIVLAQIGKRVVPEWQRVERERAVRDLHPVYDHDLVPNMDTFHQFAGREAVPFRTNSLGFRDSRVREVSLTPKRPRVLLIGDSFTEGAGYSYEDIWVGRIDAALDKQGVEVLNAGVASYSPSLYHLKVKDLLETRKLGFDHLVVFIDVSDIFDEARCYDVENDRITANRCDPRRIKPVKMFLADNSVIYRTYRLIKDGRKQQGRKQGGHLETVTGIPRSNWTYDKDARKNTGQPGMTKATAAMDKLKALLDKHAIALTVVVYPWPDQILHDRNNSWQLTHWRDWAKDNGAGFISVFEPFMAYGPGEKTIEDLFTQFDPHYNAAGHALVAETFLKHFDAKTLTVRP